MKHFFIRVWKPLPSRRILKTLKGSPKREAQREQNLLAVGISRYKWYKSQTPDNVLKGGGHEAVCQQGRWARK